MSSISNINNYSVSELLVSKELLNDEQLKLIETLKNQKKEGGVLTGGKSALHAFLLAVETQSKSERGIGLVVCPNDEDYERQVANVTDAWKDLFGETDSFPFDFWSTKDLMSIIGTTILSHNGSQTLHDFLDATPSNDSKKYTLGMGVLKELGITDPTKPYPCAKSPAYSHFSKDMVAYAAKWKWVLFLSNHDSPIHFRYMTEFYALKLVCSPRKWVIINQEKHIYQQLHYLLSASGLRWCKDLDDVDFEELNTSKYHVCDRMEKTIKMNLKKQFVIDVPDYQQIVNNNNNPNDKTSTSSTSVTGRKPSKVKEKPTKTNKGKASTKSKTRNTTVSVTKFTMNDSIEHFEYTYRRSSSWYEQVVRMFNGPGKSNMKYNTGLMEKYIEKAYSDSKHIKMIDSLVTNKTSQEKRFSPDNTLLLTSSAVIYNKFSKSSSKLGFLNKFHVVLTTKQKKLPKAIIKFMKTSVTRVVVCDPFALGTYRFDHLPRWFSKEYYSSHTSEIIFTWVMVDHIIDHSLKKQLIDSKGKTVNFVSIFNRYKKFDNYTIPMTDDYDTINSFSGDAKSKEKIFSSNSSSSSSSHEQFLLNGHVFDQEVKINDVSAEKWNTSFNCISYHLLEEYEKTGFFDDSNDRSDTGFNIKLKLENGQTYFTPKRLSPALLLQDISILEKDINDQFLLNNINQQNQILPKLWELTAKISIAQSYASLNYPKNLKKRLRTEKEIEQTMNTAKKQRITRKLQPVINEKMQLISKWQQLVAISASSSKYFEDSVESIELVIHGKSRGTDVDDSEGKQKFTLNKKTILFAMDELKSCKPSKVFDLPMQHYFTSVITNDTPRRNTCALLTTVFGYESDMIPYNRNRDEFCIIYKDGLLAYCCVTSEKNNILNHHIVERFCKKTQYLKYAPQRSHKYLNQTIDQWFKFNVPNTVAYGAVEKDIQGFYQYKVITSPYHGNWYSIRVEPN